MITGSLVDARHDPRIDISFTDISFYDISGRIDIVCPDDTLIDPFLESWDIVRSSVPLIDIAGSVGSLGAGGGGGVGDGIC